MELPEEDPPRLPGETAPYKDDPFNLGNIDDSELIVVKDLIPPPEKLVFRDGNKKNH